MLTISGSSPPQPQKLTIRLPTYSRLIAHNCSNNRPRTSLLLRAARVLATPASTAEGPRSRAARAAERPAAPVRLGRGGEPPGLISPSGVSSLPEFDKLLLWTDMSNPDDDTNVPSGLSDDAQMERTPPRARQMVISSSPAPTSTSVRTASPRTLGAADEEEGHTQAL